MHNSAIFVDTSAGLMFYFQIAQVHVKAAVAQSSAVTNVRLERRCQIVSKVKTCAYIYGLQKNSGELMQIYIKISDLELK